MPPLNNEDSSYMQNISALLGGVYGQFASIGAGIGYNVEYGPGFYVFNGVSAGVSASYWGQVNLSYEHGITFNHGPYAGIGVPTGVPGKSATLETGLAPHNSGTVASTVGVGWTDLFEFGLFGEAPGAYQEAFPEVNPAPSPFPHNHPLREESVNPSNAYVPFNDPNYSPYPDYPTKIKDGIIDLSDIDPGRGFGSGITRQDDGGWHVFEDAGDLPGLSSGEALSLRDQVSGAQANGYSDRQIGTGILEGYDLNGPETVIDFTPVPRPRFDSGSTYGNPDAGSSGAVPSGGNGDGGNPGNSPSGGRSDGHSSSYGNADAGGRSHLDTSNGQYQHNPNNWDNHSGNDSSAKPMLMDLDGDRFELIERTDTFFFWILARTGIGTRRPRPGLATGCCLSIWTGTGRSPSAKR